MTFTERAKHYYLDQSTNCAVALLMAGSDCLGLGLTMEDAKLVKGFGGGIGCGSTCGCLAGCIGVLGKLFGDLPEFRSLCSAFVAQFTAEMGGSTDCRVIMPAHVNRETRCFPAVEKAARLLEKFVANLK